MAELHQIFVEVVYTRPKTVTHPSTNRARRRVTSSCLHSLAVWRSGDVVCRINEVALRRARLVLGWVTVFGRVYHLHKNFVKCGHVVFEICETDRQTDVLTTTLSHPPGGKETSLTIYGNSHAT